MVEKGARPNAEEKRELLNYLRNPSEAGRIAGDALAFAGRAEGLLRQTLTAAGVQVPEVVNLELGNYLNDRGTKKLNFRPEQKIKDPTGLQDVFLPPAAKGLAVKN